MPLSQPNPVQINITPPPPQILSWPIIQIQFKEGFYKRIGYIEAMPHQLKYTKI
jgi:hypothetical protein